VDVVAGLEDGLAQPARATPATTRTASARLAAEGTTWRLERP